MGFSRQEYWSGLPFPSPGHPPDPGIEPRSLILQADSLPSELPVKPTHTEFPAKSFRMYFHMDSISYKWQTSWTAGFIFSLPNCLVALCWQGGIYSILFLKEKNTTWYWNYPTEFLTLRATFFFFSLPTAVSTPALLLLSPEGLGAGEEGDDGGWDGWIASLTRWTWVWVNSGSWWWTGRPGVLQFMGLQRIGHDWVTELNWKTYRNCW